MGKWYEQDRGQQCLSKQHGEQPLNQTSKCLAYLEEMSSFSVSVTLQILGHSFSSQLCVLLIPALVLQLAACASVIGDGFFLLPTHQTTLLPVTFCTVPLPTYHSLHGSLTSIDAHCKISKLSSPPENIAVSNLLHCLPI